MEAGVVVGGLEGTGVGTAPITGAGGGVGFRAHPLVLQGEALILLLVTVLDAVA